MRRRAFTLLETILALTLGSVVVLMAIGLLAGIDRSEQRMTRRYEESVGLARLHEAVQTSMASLVMAPLREDTGRSPSRISSRRAERQTNAQPRLQLIQNLSGGQGLIAPDPRQHIPESERLVGPQRLELVLSRPPLPGLARAHHMDLNDLARLAARSGPSRARDTDEPADAQRADQGADAAPPGDANPDAEGLTEPEVEPGPESVSAGAIRGAFELMPEPARRGEERTWNMVWQPMVPDALFPGRLVEPVVLARGLTGCVWEVFNDGRFGTEYSAFETQDMPGYVRLTLTTASGQFHEWLFEVLWTTGGEMSAGNDDTSDEAPDVNPDGTPPREPPGQPANVIGPGGQLRPSSKPAREEKR